METTSQTTAADRKQWTTARLSAMLLLHLAASIFLHRAAFAQPGEAVYSNRSLLVKWSNGDAALDARIEPPVLLQAVGGRVVWQSRRVPVWTVVFFPERNALEAAAVLEPLPDVVRVDKDPAIQPLAVPNDTNYVADQQSIYAPMCIEAAWEVRTTGTIPIGLPDSGVRYSFADLANNCYFNTTEWNGITNFDDDNNGVDDDYFGASFILDTNDPNWTPKNDPYDLRGHGTGMATLIGAEGNNGSATDGLTGIAWNCTIIPAKIMNAETVSDEDFVSQAVMGIEYCILTGAKIINCSWFVYEHVWALYDMIKDYPEIIFVIAAGNHCVDLDVQCAFSCCIPPPSGCRGIFPAQYEHDNMIVVGGTDLNDMPWNQGNCCTPGGSAYGSQFVDVYAPGGEIAVTYDLNGQRVQTSGTSNSCAIVCGIIALVWSQFPILSVTEVINQVISTADFSSDLVGLCAANGRVNAAAALGSECP